MAQNINYDESKWRHNALRISLHDWPIEWNLCVSMHICCMLCSLFHYSTVYSPSLSGPFCHFAVCVQLTQVFVGALLSVVHFVCCFFLARMCFKYFSEKNLIHTHKLNTTKWILTISIACKCLQNTLLKTFYCIAKVYICEIQFPTFLIHRYNFKMCVIKCEKWPYNFSNIQWNVKTIFILLFLSLSLSCNVKQPLKRSIVPVRRIESDFPMLTTHPPKEEEKKTQIQMKKCNEKRLRIASIQCCNFCIKL